MVKYKSGNQTSRGRIPLAQKITQFFPLGNCWFVSWYLTRNASELPKEPTSNPQPRSNKHEKCDTIEHKTTAITTMNKILKEKE